MEKLHDNIGFLIGLTARSMKAHFNKKLREEGEDLTIDQLRVVKVLFHHDGLSQQELADMLVLEKPGITKQIDLLEHKGYVERRVDPQDRRHKRVYCTPQAHRLHDRVMKIAERERRAIGHGISESQMDAFRHVCQRILLNIQSQESENQ